MESIDLKVQLTDQERLIVSSELENRKKRKLVAYLLWWAMFIFPAHKFYLRKRVSAILQFILIIVFAVLDLGVIILIWIVIDAILIPFWVRKCNKKLEQEIAKEVLSRRQSNQMNPYTWSY
jgi:TM2 domain-containing membrane protein YozV